MSVEGFVLVTNQPPPVPISYLWRVSSTLLTRMAGAFRSRVTLAEEERLNRFPETQDALRAVNQLLNTDGVFFTSTVVEQYLKVLWTEYPTKFHYATEGVKYLIDHQKSPFQVAEKVYEFVQINPHTLEIAIPFDANQHHIVIYIDRSKNTVEYYDPLGNRPETTTIERGLLYSLKEEVEKIAHLFFGEEGKIYVNTGAHQNCCFRCAIWGLLYIERRLKGIAACDIESSTVSSDEIDRYRREIIAEKIKTYALRLLTDLEAEEQEGK